MRSGWSQATLVLAVLLVLLGGAITVTALVSEDGGEELAQAVAPWRSQGDDLTALHKEVAEAARAETLAFLAVDYRDMDPIMDRVLDGATGGFKQQYAARREDLKKRAIDNKSVSTGEVVALGVGDLRSDSARVYVAANSEVQDAGTDGARQPRYYRLQLDLVREGGAWLTSSLQFVG